MQDYIQYLICYDTPDNRRRRQIVKLLEESLERVQWSVFEGWLTSVQADKLTIQLSRVIEPGLDNIRIYRLCTYCRGEIQILGLGAPTELIRYWIV